VPKVALYATAKKLARPSRSEGFDELFYVSITGDPGFEVHTCTDEVDST
jgi:hypothetical protein